MFVGLRYLPFFLLLILTTSWISASSEMPVLEIRSTHINQSLLSSDGQNILMASGSQILVWDIYKKQILQRYHSAEQKVTAMNLSKDGLWLVAGYENGELALWDANTFEVVHQFVAHNTNITQVHVHSSSIIASGDENGQVKTWELANAQLQSQMNAHQAAITALDISPDGQTLLTASMDNNAKLWTLGEDEPIQTLVGHLAEINTACFLNESTILTGSNDKTISAWSLQTGEIAYTLLGHSSKVLAVKNLPGQGKFVSSTDNGEIIVWDKSSMKELDRFVMKNVQIQHVDIQKNILLRLHADHHISLWNLTEQKETETIHISSTPVLAGQVFNSEDFILVGDKKGTIKKHQLSNGDLIQHYSGHEKAINALAKSPDGSVFATASNDKLIKLWNSQSGELLQTLEGHKSAVLSLAFSADGKFLYTGGKDKLIKWWNLSSGVEINSFKAHGADITQIIPLQDNNVLSVSKDKKVKIYHIEKGSLEMELGPHICAISSAAYAPKDSLVYIGDVEGKITSYHIGQKTMMDRMSGHSGAINSLDINEDCTYLLSSSEDKTSNLWNLPSKTIEHSFLEHKAPLRYCSFGQDEKTIITTSLDKQILVWSISELVQR